MSDSAELPEQHAIRIAKLATPGPWSPVYSSSISWTIQSEAGHMVVSTGYEGDGGCDDKDDAAHIAYNADPERVQEVNEIVAAAREYCTNEDEFFGGKREEDHYSTDEIRRCLARLDEMERKR